MRLAVPEREPRTFSPATMISLIVVATLAAGALAALSAYAPQLRSGNDGGAHALSKSAVGYAAVARLLPKIGRPVVVSRARVGARSNFRLLIATPQVGADAGDVNNLRPAAVRMLVVLPKWNTAPAPLHKGWTRRVGLTPPELVEAGVLEFVSPDGAVSRQAGTVSTQLSIRPIPQRPSTSPNRAIRSSNIPFTPPPVPPAKLVRTGPIESLQTISGRNLEPIITDAQGRTVLAQFKGNQVFILSDPDLLNTQGMSDPSTARAGLALIDHVAGAQGAVAFDATLHGYARSRNILRLALEPPLLGGTLCLLAAGVLAGLHAAVRFGSPRPAPRAIAFGKRALADSTAGLIHLAGKEHRMGARYAAFARGEVARAVGAPHDLTDDQLDAFLDRLSAQAGAPAFTALREDARRATGVGELLAAARRIWDWRVEMTRERR